MALPPGLEGWVLSQQQNRQRDQGDIQNLAGILSIQGALESQRQAALLHPLQLQQLQDKINAEKRKDAALASLAQLIGGNQSAASQGALAQGGAAGDVGPTVTNAQRMGVLQQNNLPAIDRGLASATLAGVDPKVGSFLRDIAVPKMETSGGYAFDPRRVQSGFLPQMQIGREGQATVSIPGAGGIPNIFAPPGALETFGAYKDIGNASEARYQPFEVKPTTPSANPTIMSRLDVLGGGGQPRQTVPSAGPTAPGAFPGSPAGSTVVPSSPTAIQGNTDYRNTAPGDREVETLTNMLKSASPESRARILSMFGRVADSGAPAAPGPAVASGAAPLVPSPVPTRSVMGTPSGLSPQQESQQSSRTAANTEAGKEFISEMRKNYSMLRDADVTLRNIEQAKAAIPDAKFFMGPVGETKLEVAKFLRNAMGVEVNVDGVTSAEELRTRAFMGVMENLKKMDAQPSEYQQKVLQSAFGTLGTDPAALPKVLDVFGDIVRQRVAIHNKTVDDAVSGGTVFPYSVKVNISPPGVDTAIRDANRGGSAPRQAVTRITTDADFNALSPGTLFIGPDGKTRRKP